MTTNQEEAATTSGRTIAEGVTEGEVLVSPEPISFYGAIDTKTGEFIEEDHHLTGQNVAGKVLIFPKGKGSTVGSYVIYGLAKEGTGPAAIVNHETETIVATGAILGDVPCIDGIDDAVTRFDDGERVRVDATEGTITRLEDD